MKSAIKCVLAAAALGLLPMSTVLAQGQAPPNPWNVSLGSLLWTRTMPSGPVFVDRNTGATLVDTANMMSFGATGGPYASVGRWLNKAWKVEGSFFGFYDWRATGSSTLDATTAPTAVLAFPNF